MANAKMCFIPHLPTPVKELPTPSAPPTTVATPTRTRIALAPSHGTGRTSAPNPAPSTAQPPVHVPEIARNPDTALVLSGPTTTTPRSASQWTTGSTFATTQNVKQANTNMATLALPRRSTTRSHL